MNSRAFTSLFVLLLLVSAGCFGIEGDNDPDPEPGDGVDSDGDGYWDNEEVVAGSDPNDASVIPDTFEGEDSHNDNTAGARTLGPDTVVMGSISVTEDESDFFLLPQLSPHDWLVLRLEGDVTDADLFLWYEGTVVSTSDALGSEEAIEVEILQTAGTWAVEVYAFEGSGSYTLQVDTPVPVGVNDLVNGTFTTNDGADLFRVDLTAEQYVIATLAVPEGADFDLYLYDADEGDLLDASYQVYGGESVAWASASQLSLIVWVDRWEGTGNYTFWTYLADLQPADSNNDWTEAAALTNPNDAVTTTLDMVNDLEDWYTVSISSGQTLDVSLTSPDVVDFDLYLEDGMGNLLDFSEGFDADEEVSATALADDTYYLIVTSFIGSGTYTLTSSITGVAGTPVAIAGVDVTADEGVAVQFDGSASADDGTITGYDWIFGDGNTASGVTVSNTYTTPGTYTVQLTVTDDQAMSSSDELIVTVETAGVDRYALIVGISDYDSVAENYGWRDLSYADDDARDWRDYLEGIGYTVQVLEDSNATYAAIISGLDWLRQNEDADDYIAVIWSGHGGQCSDGEYSSNCDNALLPAYDARSGANHLTDLELETQMSDFQSSHIFTFVDACYSGGFAEMGVGPGRLFTATSAHDQLGLDVPRYQNGMWVYWFLEWALIQEGYTNLEDAYTAAAPLAAANSDEAQNEMDPQLVDADPTIPFTL